MFTINRGGPRRTLLYQAVKQLVVASDRLMGCPMCGRPFLARLKKKFCSSGCLREWYDKRSKRGDA
jgi:hypothetical protein